jgi:hypothetical protein
MYECSFVCLQDKTTHSGLEILAKCDQKYIFASALHYVNENFSDYIFRLYLTITPDF